jgi:hypothetical protein
MATAATKPTAAKTRALTQERAEKTAVLPVRTPNVKWDVSRFGPPGALRNTWCMNAPDSVSYKISWVRARTSGARSPNARASATRCSCATTA